METACNHEIQGCLLHCSCPACPEQYDVYQGEYQIGYLRLRHGYFRADYVALADARETVYEGHPKGDGVFEPEERERFLTEAVQALLKKHNAGSSSFVWTKEPPTVRGWYWYRKHPTWSAKCVEVKPLHSTAPDRLMYDDWDVHLHEGEWAGPIPQPN
jgi:hypothetical protein